MNFLFLMDPLHTVIYEKDTTFVLMLESYKRGHQVFYLPANGIIKKDNKFLFSVTHVKPQVDSRQPFVELEKKILTDDQVQIIFIRTDPPFDEQYLMNTWLLDLLAPRIVIMNNPTGVRTVNEKVWATQFSTIVPPTFIGCHKKELLLFLSEHKDIIAKPANGYGGQGIFRVKSGDTNANVILETLTKRFNRAIILQQYIPAAVHGDKRILLLNGEPLGAVLRVHAEGDHRNNFFAGGKPYATDLTKRDKEIIEVLRPRLKRLGLYFVGIDVIGNYLTEVNVTSPTCLQEMNRLNNVHLEQKVVDFALKLVDQTSKKPQKISKSKARKD